MHVPASNPAQRAWAVTPSDTLPVSYGVSGVSFARGVLASGPCLVRVTTLGGDIVTLPFQAGYNPVSITQVWNSGTSLGGYSLFGLY